MCEQLHLHDSHITVVRLVLGVLETLYYQQVFCFFVFSDSWDSSEDAVSKKWGSVYPQIQHQSGKQNHERPTLIVRH